MKLECASVAALAPALPSGRAVRVAYPAPVPAHVALAPSAAEAARISKAGGEALFWNQAQRLVASRA
jgi:hypothetical protein